MYRLLGILTVGAALLAAGASTAAQDGAKTKRAIYPVKHAAAKDLAAALAKQYKGALDVEGVTGQGGGFLLVSGTASAVDELAAALQTLDRPPATYAIEILLIDGKYGAGESQFDESELTGPANRVRTRLQAMRANGQIAGIRILTLTAVENVKVTTTFSESRPYVLGTRPAFGGKGNPGGAASMQFRDVGTKASLTPLHASDKNVTVEIDLEDSRIFTPADGVEVGTDGKGAPVMAPEFGMARSTARLVVPYDQLTAVQGFKVNTKSRQTQTLALIGVRLIDAGAKGK